MKEGLPPFKAWDVGYVDRIHLYRGGVRGEPNLRV